jgi:hypothetical protein
MADNHKPGGIWLELSIKAFLIGEDIGWEFSLSLSSSALSPATLPKNCKRTIRLISILNQFLHKKPQMQSNINHKRNDEETKKRDQN